MRVAAILEGPRAQSVLNSGPFRIFDDLIEPGEPDGSCCASGEKATVLIYLLWPSSVDV